MKPAQRQKLTAELRDHVAKVTADLRAKIREPGEARRRAKQLHQDEKVGEDFEVWTDLLARRAAVLWVLKSVYVRVLEDRGLLAPGRILDVEAQQLFERLAPNLGETAFLRWIYRDLASANGGLPELFGPQPAEIACPSDDLSRELLEFWRHRNPDTGAQWSFAEETFEGELMGDLYQELDPVVKERFALCQTPDFVRAFILDRTLTPAIETFGADVVRLIDPACGSGHFLIDGLKRLVAATAAVHPDWDRKELVSHCLGRVVGVDLNDYACALARARLIMTAAELAGMDTLAAASTFHPHVYWADGLEQVEGDEKLPALQFDLFSQVEVKPRATLTRSDVRGALRKVFETGFHAVVANPPYITEKDKARKEYHREKVGKRQRYVSAYREYSLGAPFTERCFQLAAKEGFVGLITGNNFMKREFGKALIQEVLSTVDLTLVVDASQAYIPFHGTPTVLLFGRNRKPSSESVRAVMGKRGESGVPDDPAQGRVWASILEGYKTVGFESEYVSVSDADRDTFRNHPWSLGGGGASELKSTLEERGKVSLGQCVDSVGFMCITKQDDVFVQDGSVLMRHRCEESWIRSFVSGDTVRDWSIAMGQSGLFPYDQEIGLLGLDAVPEVARYLQRFRRVLEERAIFGGDTFRTKGRSWWEYGQISKDRFRTPLSIGYAEIATHNHFALDRDGRVFSQTAPVIKLPPEAGEESHLSLLGILNSSVACFWMKQVFHNKGAGGIGGGYHTEMWSVRFAHDGTKMKLFPVAGEVERTACYARCLDAIASKRASFSAAAVLGMREWDSAKDLRFKLERRREQDFVDFQRMIALQEELDWLCYSLYGLDEKCDVVAPDKAEPLLPTSLPWCIAFARRDADNRAALQRGEVPDELPSVWFERHGWEPQTELPTTLSQGARARVQARLARTAKSPELTLIESPNYKRRWYKPDYEAQEREALVAWLAERVEAIVKTREVVVTLDQLVSALQDDSRVLAVSEVLTGRPDVNLSSLVMDALVGDSVPCHRIHIYNVSGLTKRAAWERTWDDQRRENAGEDVIPEVPPSYQSTDFLRTEY